MKKELTIEERASARTKLDAQKATLENELAQVRADYDARTQKRHEHRMGLEMEASCLLAAALPVKLLNGGAIVATAKHDWSYGDGAKYAMLEISRPESRHHDFAVKIKNGGVYQYSAYSQSGNGANADADAKETIAYYEVVSTLLAFILAPENKALLTRICELVNTPCPIEEPEQGRNANDIHEEIKHINAKIRRLDVFIGAKGHYMTQLGRLIDFVVEKVTPNTFTFKSIVNGEVSKWPEKAKIDDKQYIFGAEV